MNTDLSLWDTVAYGVSTGGSLSVGLVFLRILFGRLDKKEAHVDAATKNLIDELRKELTRLSDECVDLRKKWLECERSHADTHAALMEVQALLQAKGEIRNSIQMGVAAEKLLGDGRKGK